MHLLPHLLLGLVSHPQLRLAPSPGAPRAAAPPPLRAPPARPFAAARSALGHVAAARAGDVVCAEEAMPQLKVEPSRKSRSGPRKAIWAVRRTIFIWCCAINQLSRVLLLRRRNLKGAKLVEARRGLAADLRDTLILLGPTFIKIGQLLSTRVDVLPREVVSELSRLQNDCPAFPAKRARAVIEKSLGGKVGELFETFTPEPLAAASLAQVHLATLKGSGEQVIVKVQRENLIELFGVDLWNINLVATLADKFDPQTEGVASNWKGVADTSGEVLYREVDFNYERASAEEFGANFASTPTVKVPKMFPELCSSRVLTMEYCPGVKISDTAALEAKGYDTVHIAKQLTDSYLEQVCRHGFFHCDPHPGNLAVDDGHPGGRLVYYDFGMMERVDVDVKKGFVDLVFSIYENLPREACDALEAMGCLRPGIDRFSIERIARSLLNTFQSTLASADNVWENQMSAEEKRSSRRDRRAKLGQDLFATQAEKPFLFPPKFTFVFRAFSTIDGIGKGLDPKAYDLSRMSQPYLRELANLRDGSTTTTAFKEVGKRLGLRPIDISQVVRQPRVVSTLSKSVQRIEEGEVKLRVRALEVERMIERVELRQRFVGAGLGTAFLYQIALSIPRQLCGVRWLGHAPLALAACRLGWEALAAYKGMNSMEEQRLRFANQGTTKFDEDDVYGTGEGFAT